MHAGARAVSPSTGPALTLHKGGGVGISRGFPMAWQGSDRAARLPPNWRTLRLRVLRRDGWRCVARMSDGTRCPEPATEVDHKTPGDDHSPSNLQALCGWHHARKSAREGAAASRAKLAPRNREPEPHPAFRRQ